MKKAQLTMFIILGIVIISVFGFVLFATSEVQRTRSAQQAEQIVSQVLESTSLKFYINLCAEQALNRGIDVLSKQGGKILPGQFAATLTNTEKTYLYKEQVSNRTYSISYAVLKDNIPLPQYPCKPGYEDFSKSPAYCRYFSVNKGFDGLELGKINMPEFCRDSSSGCSFTEGWDERFSVQSQLENFVSEYVKNCVDLQSIIGINQTYNVTEGNVTANLTFSDEDITAKIHFPVVVRALIGQPVITLVTFQTSVPTRFKLLYGIAKESVSKDVISPDAVNFNIVSGFNKIAKGRFSGGESGFEIQKQENTTLYDNLIQIVDRTVTAGRGLVFQFLIENRPPILEYINPPNPIDTGCGVYDIIQLEGTTLKMQPKAFDTEEDIMNFTYSGWLYDYNETITGQNIGPNGCVLSSVIARNNYISQNQRRWLTDVNFRSTGNASVALTVKDIGPHNFTIKVCDSQYCDYEVIRVLVDDLLKVVLNRTNPYGTKTFSIEDPYTFTVNINNFYGSQFYDFSWVINKIGLGGLETQVYENTSGSKALRTPLQNYDILNIAQQNSVLNSNQLFEVNSQYKAIAKAVQQGYQASDEATFRVEKCVVNLNPQGPPFPYNTSDPFNATHACCIQATPISTPDYKPAGTPCYTPPVTYGSYNSFNSTKYKTNYDTIFVPVKTFLGFSPDITATDKIQAIKLGISSTPKIIYKSSNDIINKSFIRNCDGTRGNVCTGNMNEKYTVIQVCQDLKAGEIATCFGPPKDTLKTNSEITSRPQCEAYGDVLPGQIPTTFENLTGVRSDNLCGSTPKCVSTDNAPDGFLDENIFLPNAHFVCNATCGPEGCTRTTPLRCIDCFDRQTCTLSSGSPAPTDITPSQKLTIRYKEFTSNTECINNKQCVVSSPIDKTDSCLAAVPGKDWLVDYSCKTPTEKKITPPPYKQILVNCSSYNERKAFDSDSGNFPLTIGSCTHYPKGGCFDGKCEAPSTAVTLDEKQNPDPTVGFNGEYKFIEYQATSLRGNSTLEFCYPIEWSFDSSPDLCTSLRYPCSSNPAKPGVWSSGVCVGDDFSERAGC